LNWDNCSARNIGYVPEVPTTVRIRKRLLMMVEELGYGKNVDKQSNGQEVKMLLRCDSSSCFDKYNICCKACDIKKCRYKCNYFDKDVCEHQFIE
jgi:hypothetical protein